MLIAVRCEYGARSRVTDEPSPNLTGKTPEDPFKPYSRCAGCGLVSYCSKECQRKGWTRGKSVDNRDSHRPLCKDLGRLRHVWPQTDDIQFELIPELRFTLYAPTHGTSTQGIIDRMGQDEVNAAIATSKAFPGRAWNYLNPENDNT